MKHWILALLTLLGSSFAIASTKKPALNLASEFNQMIQENQAAEAQLSAKLRLKAGIRVNVDQPGTIPKEKLNFRETPEQIVVSTSDEHWEERKKQARKAAQDSSEMRRISQEMKEASD